MIKKENLTEAGRVLKTHGINGEIVVTSAVELDSRVFQFVFIEIDGNVVPFEIVQFRWISDDAGILKMKDVSEQESKELVGGTCYVLSNQIVHEDLESSAFSMEGYKLFTDTNEYIGLIENIDRQSSNMLFVVQRANGDEILIPIAEEYFVEMNHEEQRVVLNLPEGLLELYS